MPLPGVEVRIADDVGNTLPTGEIGRLLTRACSNFGGYLKRPHLNATDADGWFDTGDLARVDDKDTSASPVAQRTSSFVAVRTSPSSRLRTCCIGIHRLPKLPSLRTQMNVLVAACAVIVASRYFDRLRWNDRVLDERACCEELSARATRGLRCNADNPFRQDPKI